MQHEKVNPGKKRYVTKEIYHIQNVNSYQERFKSFLAHFRGVSTKYLNHYVSWHRFMDQTTTLQPLLRVKDLFARSLMQPMKTNGTVLSIYCEEQIRKLIS